MTAFMAEQREPIVSPSLSRHSRMLCTVSSSEKMAGHCIVRRLKEQTANRSRLAGDARNRL